MGIIRKNLYNKKDKFPNSEYFYKNSFSIPIFPNLSLKNQKYIINKISNYLY